MYKSLLALLVMAGVVSATPVHNTFLDSQGNPLNLIVTSHPLFKKYTTATNTIIPVDIITSVKQGEFLENLLPGPWEFNMGGFGVCRGTVPTATTNIELSAICDGLNNITWTNTNWPLYKGEFEGDGSKLTGIVSTNESIPVEKTYFWSARTDGKRGAGTFNNPYDASTASKFHDLWATQVLSTNWNVPNRRFVVKPGTYYITNRLLFPAWGSNLTFSGYGATIMVSNSAISSSWTAFATDWGSTNFAFLRNTTFEGFDIDCGSMVTMAGDGSVGGVGLAGDFCTVRNCQVRNLVVKGAWEAFGITIFGTNSICMGNRVENLIVQGSGGGATSILVQGSGSLIENNTANLHDPGDNGTYSIGYASFGKFNSIVGNAVSECDYGISMDGAGGYTGDNVWNDCLVANNMISGSVIAFRIHPIATQSYRNWNVVGNTFDAPQGHTWVELYQHVGGTITTNNLTTGFTFVGNRFIGSPDMSGNLYFNNFNWHTFVGNNFVSNPVVILGTNANNLGGTANYVQGTSYDGWLGKTNTYIGYFVGNGGGLTNLAGGGGGGVWSAGETNIIARTNGNVVWFSTTLSNNWLGSFTGQGVGVSNVIAKGLVNNATVTNLLQYGWPTFYTLVEDNYMTLYDESISKGTTIGGGYLSYNITNVFSYLGSYFNGMGVTNSVLSLGNASLATGGDYFKLGSGTALFNNSLNASISDYGFRANGVPYLFQSSQNTGFESPAMGTIKVNTNLLVGGAMTANSLSLTGTVNNLTLQSRNSGTYGFSLSSPNIYDFTLFDINDNAVAFEVTNTANGSYSIQPRTATKSLKFVGNGSGLTNIPSAAISDTLTPVGSNGVSVTQAGTNLIFGLVTGSVLDAKTMFGAKGDGVTDDTIALTNALWYLVTNTVSKDLRIPAGTYKTTGEVLIPETWNQSWLGTNSFVIHGDGTDVTIIEGTSLTGTNCGLAYRTHASPLANLNHCRISDLSIRGPYYRAGSGSHLYTGTYAGCGIKITYEEAMVDVVASWVTFENVNVNGFAYGYWIGPSSIFTTFRNCTVANSRYAGWFLMRADNLNMDGCGGGYGAENTNVTEFVAQFVSTSQSAMTNGFTPNGGNQTGALNVNINNCAFGLNRAMFLNAGYYFVQGGELGTIDASNSLQCELVFMTNNVSSTWVGLYAGAQHIGPDSLSTNFVYFRGTDGGFAQMTLINVGLHDNNDAKVLFAITNTPGYGFKYYEPIVIGPANFNNPINGTSPLIYDQNRGITNRIEVVGGTFPKYAYTYQMPLKYAANINSLTAEQWVADGANMNYPDTLTIGIGTNAANRIVDNKLYIPPDLVTNSVIVHRFTWRNKTATNCWCAPTLDSRWMTPSMQEMYVTASIPGSYTNLPQGTNVVICLTNLVNSAYAPFSSSVWCRMNMSSSINSNVFYLLDWSVDVYKLGVNGRSVDY